MGHSAFDPAIRERQPWNAGRMVGAKPALKPQPVWAIRFWLDRERRLRDRALFDLATDSQPPPLTLPRPPHKLPRRSSEGFPAFRSAVPPVSTS